MVFMCSGQWTLVLGNQYTIKTFRELLTKSALHCRSAWCTQRLRVEPHPWWFLPTYGITVSVFPTTVALMKSG
jgi:hypothetical protein